MKHKATAKNVADVLEKFAKFVRTEDLYIRRDIADDLNQFLDEYAANDLFGTEAQLDPRGDQRD